jgi:hypothetical protein
VAAPDSGFSVTYTLNKFQAATVPVQVIHVPGDFSAPASTTIDPNPVVAELQPAAPPPRAAARKMQKAKKPKQPNTAAASTGSPFPESAPKPPSR